MRSPFALIRRFGKDIPRELELFEKNVATKFKSDDDAAYGPFSVTDLKTSDYAAKPWEFVRCDPSPGAFQVSLPPANDPRSGEIIVRNDSDSTHTITVSSYDGRSTVNGGTDVSLSTARASVQLVPCRETNDWMALFVGQVDAASVVYDDSLITPSLDVTVQGALDVIKSQYLYTNERAHSFTMDATGFTPGQSFVVETLPAYVPAIDSTYIVSAGFGEPLGARYHIMSAQVSASNEVTIEIWNDEVSAPTPGTTFLAWVWVRKGV